MPAAPRKRRPPVARHFKIDALLAPDQRDDYESLLRDRGTTTDAAHAWLTARGVACSRSAVARHRRHVLATALQRDAHAQAVRELLDTAKRLDGSTLSDALLGASQAMLILRLADAVEQVAHAPLPAADLAALIQSVQRSLATRRQHDAARAAPPPAPQAAATTTEKPAPLTAAEAKAALDAVEERVANYLKDNPPTRQ